ncbi:hypothetical protein ONZ45_g1272 [Pleurotus djamor]|nr:hypothetical protein ONZ45_g1272 [Pleurotus djamor]
MKLQATYDAYVPSNIKDFFALAKLQPEYIPLKDMRLHNLTPAQQSSFDFAQKVTVPGAFHHSIRCFYFALAILCNGFPSNTPGVAQITSEELVERIFHSCILHDIGLTRNQKALQHPAHAMSFELHGGIMAYEHLQTLEPKLTAEQLGDIVQGIMLHTVAFSSGKQSASAFLVQIAALFDLQGYDALGPHSLDRIISKKTVGEIEKTYPRGSLPAEIQEHIYGQLRDKPDCLMSHMPLDFGSKAAAIKSLVVNGSL